MQHAPNVKRNVSTPRRGIERRTVGSALGRTLASSVRLDRRTDTSRSSRTAWRKSKRLSLAWPMAALKSPYPLPTRLRTQAATLASRQSAPLVHLIRSHPLLSSTRGSFPIPFGKPRRANKASHSAARTPAIRLPALLLPSHGSPRATPTLLPAPPNRPGTEARAISMSSLETLATLPSTEEANCDSWEVERSELSWKLSDRSNRSKVNYRQSCLFSVRHCHLIMEEEAKPLGYRGRPTSASRRGMSSFDSSTPTFDGYILSFRYSTGRRSVRNWRRI